MSTNYFANVSGKANMKLLLLIVSVAFLGGLTLASDSIDDPLQQMQQEIKQLKKSDEAMEKNYNEKIERLRKHYDEKIESLKKNYDEEMGNLEHNYEQKIASLEQQLKLVKKFEPQLGKLVLLFFLPNGANSEEKGHLCG